MVHERGIKVNPEKIKAFTITALIFVKWKELSEEEKQAWKAKATEVMEAYKKELEEYNNSIIAATNDKQQPQKELVEEEEEHTTSNTIAGAKDAKPKKNKSKPQKTVEYV
ncbi:hypothetical protein Q3G72_031859 [Acer saccharum]|nr:hypothetical protein Q3G72_031859 [Acer saccharum]